MNKKEFNLDAEITKLNTPERYNSVKKRYDYSEADILGLFEKLEAVNATPLTDFTSKHGHCTYCHGNQSICDCGYQRS